MRLAVLASNTVHFSKRTAQVGALPHPLPYILESMRLAVLASNTVHFSKRTAQVGALPHPLPYILDP
jgi:hypothetical protein